MGSGDPLTGAKNEFQVSATQDSNLFHGQFLSKSQIVFVGGGAVV